jgi:uncharacterized protein
MRNFLMGLIKGGVVAALGLGAVSYLLPARVDLAPIATPAPQEAAPAAAPESPAPQPPDPNPSAPADPAPAPVPAAPAEPVPDAPKPEPLLDISPAPTPVPNPAPTPAPAEPQAPPQAAPPAPALDAARAAAPPLQRYAAAFDGAGGKPLFAVVLLDTASADIDRAVLASLPFAVTFAVDPDSPTAAEAMALYRAAGKEVLIMPTSLPSGANAQDIAQSFAVYAAVLPETVGVFSPPQGGFQDDLALSRLVLAEIAAQGRGLVVMDKGLNSAAQIAQRESLPYAVIGRIIDEGDVSVPVMRRYLDRAVFAAAQTGAAVVMGRTNADTIAALTAWALEGRSSDVTLAPISALMQP